jgi:hypothetical protein
MTMTSRAAPDEMDPDRLAAWAALLEAQSGAVGFRQLIELGVTESTIVAQVTAQRWQRPVRGVYVTFTGPLPRATRMAVALLYGGPAAVLSHRSAAEEWGLLPIDDDADVHVTVPYGTSAITQPGIVVVHRSRAYRHIVVEAVPPRTTRADTAVDLAADEADARSAARVLTGLLTGGRVRVLDVERRLMERPPRRYRRALARAVRLVRDGVQSVLEELYAVEVEQAHGLPPARRQGAFSVDGVTLYEDATYDHVGVPLTVRLDGRTHLVDSVAFRDRRRDNAGELAARSRLTFGWHDLSRDPCGGAAEVALVLRRRGWDGETVRCSRCS